MLSLQHKKCPLFFVEKYNDEKEVKTMTKKHSIIAMLLAFALIFTLMPMPAYAANTVSVDTAQKLYDAFSNASSGDVIKLTADINYDLSPITVTKDATLDFNGHSISIAPDELFNINTSVTLNLLNPEITSGACLVSQNSGTLNIKGSHGDGIQTSDYVIYENTSTGVLNFSDAAVDSYYLIYYIYGEATITNTSFKGTNLIYQNFGNTTLTDVNAVIEYSLVDENYASIVFNNVTIVSNGYAFPIEDQYDYYYEDFGIPSCVINGGTFEGSYMNCCMYGYCEINGGTFDSNYYMEIYGEDCPTTVVVNGGDFTAHNNNVFYLGSDESTLIITGGTFKADGNYKVIDVGYSEDTVYLKGGTFITNGTNGVFNNEYENIIIPDGYVAIPEDWQETNAQTVTIVPEVFRCGGANRYETAIKAADALKAQMKLEKFDAVILACGTNYADALAGSYLATAVDAPILLIDDVPAAVTAVQTYIKNNLTPGGVIYILGGEKAVSPSTVEGLSGYEFKRIAGDNRFETNISILEEAGVTGNEILICSGTGFADSLSASATGMPILLVGSTILDSQKSFIQSLSGKDFYVIGGNVAVNQTIEAYFSNIGTTERIGGANRYETSTNVAREFFDYPSRAVLAYGQNFPDGLSGGPLAHAMGGPLILAANGSSAKAATYAKDATIRSGAVMGGPTLISDDEVRTIFRLEDSVQIISK